MTWFKQFRAWILKRVWLHTCRNRQPVRKRKLAIELAEQRVCMAVDAIVAVDNVAPLMGTLLNNQATNDSQLELRVFTPHPGSVADISLSSNAGGGQLVQIFEDVPIDAQGMARVVTNLLADADYVVRARAGTLAKYFITCDCCGLAAFETEGIFQSRIDSVAPRAALTSAVTPTTSGPIPVSLQFTEPVTGFSLNDLAIQNGTIAANLRTAQASATAAANSIFTFDVLPKSDGPVVIHLPAGVAYDDAQNRNTSSNTLRFVNDTTPPRLQSLERSSPITTTTNADALTFRATFSEAVEQVNATDFLVTGTAANVTNVNRISPRVYELTVAGGGLANLNGMAGIDLNPTQNIVDAVGNRLLNNEPAVDQKYRLDNTPPQVLAIRRFNPSTVTSSADQLVFRVQFNEPVVNLISADFLVTGTTGTITNLQRVSTTVYELTVGGGNLPNLNGVVGIDLNSTSSVRDAIGNIWVKDEPAVDETYTITNTLPQVIGFTRSNPLQAITNADTLTFRVRFTTDMVNVDRTDFRATGTTAAISSVTVVSPREYLIDVAGGNLANLAGVVGLNFAVSENIADAFGNRLPSTEPGTDETYLLDNNAPITIGFRRNTPVDPRTNADTLEFLATFSEAVLNVDAADFAVNGTTGVVTQAVLVSPTAFRITVVGGDLSGLNGTVNLNLSPSGNITDIAGNRLNLQEPATDADFNIDNVAPVVLSFETQQPSTTNADRLVWRVTFSEPVENVTPDNFVPSSSTARATNVSAISPTVYEVEISGGNLANFSGVVGLNLAPSLTIHDRANVSLINAEPPIDQSYTLDNLAPNFLAIQRFNPNFVNTDRNQVQFELVFDEIITNLDASDLRITGTTASISNISPAGFVTRYLVEISGGDLSTLNGVVGIDLAPTQNIRDRVGNLLPNSEPTRDEVYNVVNLAPRLVAFSRVNPDANVVTNADTLEFRAVFNTSVQNVSPGDFIVNGVQANVLSVVSSTPKVYIVTIGGGDLPNVPTATVGLDLNGTQDIANADGIRLLQQEPPLTDQTYRVDNLRPSATISTRGVVNNPTNSNAIPLQVTFDETVIGLTAADVQITNGTLQNFRTSNNSLFLFEVAGNTSGSITVQVNDNVATDLPGNGNLAASPFSIQYDNIAPRVTAFSRRTPSAATTNVDSLLFRVTFSEPVSNVTAGDFSLFGTSATITNINPLNATTFDLLVSGGDLPNLNGLVGLDVSNTRDVTDVAGNRLLMQEPVTDELYLVDNSPPTVNISTTAISPTNQSPIPFQIVFSGPVIGFNSTDVSVSGGEVQNFTGNGQTFTFNLSISSPSTLSVDVPANVASDGAGNGNLAGSPVVVQFDNQKPQLLEFTRLNPANSTTNADSLTFRATFDEPVSNVSAGDFTVVGATTATVNVTAVSATVYQIRLNGSQLTSFNGLVGLNLSANADIQDLAGNDLEFAEPSVDETYLLDNNSPGVLITSSVAPLTNQSPIPVQVAFAESVTNFTSADVILSSGQLQNFSGSGVNYSFEILTSVSATITVDILGNIANDAAGNGNAAASPFSISYDNVAPRVISFTRQNPTAAITSADTLVFRATFSEDVTGVTTDDFIVNGAAIPIANITPISTTVYELVLSNSVLAGFNGDVGIDLTTSPNINDTAGNALATTEPGIDEFYTLDNLPPTPVLIYNNPNPTNQSPIPVIVDFGEAVTGFDAGDISVLNGTVQNFNQLAPGRFEFEIDTGLVQQADIIVRVPENIASDIVGNSNLASNVLTINFDRIAPTATLTYQPPVIGNSGSGLVQIDFSESINGISISDFSLAINGTLVPLSAATLSGTGGSYILNLTNIPQQSGEYALTLEGPPTEITDLAGNFFQQQVTVSWTL